VNPAATTADLIALSGDNAFTLTVDADGVGVDVSDLDGAAMAILIHKNNSGTTPTADVKLQESETLNGTYTDVPSGAFAQKTTVAGLQTLHIPDIAQTKGFLRFKYDTGGTTPNYSVAGIIVGRKKYRN